MYLVHHLLKFIPIPTETQYLQLTRFLRIESVAVAIIFSHYQLLLPHKLQFSKGFVYPYGTLTVAFHLYICTNGFSLALSSLL